MYAWATKEYLLWEMTIGQIFLYHNRGIKIKNGDSTDKDSLVNKDVGELRKMKEEAQAIFEAEERNRLKSVYGDIDG